jgi:L-ascorbate metabolism protein UlaG (beta-lactamase superfamily)
MGKYIVVVIIVILTAILAGILPYAQTTNGQEKSLVAVFDTFYSAELDAKEIAVCYLGGSTFFVRTSEHVILINPADKISSSDVPGIKRLDLILAARRDNEYYDLEVIRRIYQKTNSTILVDQPLYDEVIDLLGDDIPSEKLRRIHSGEELVLSGMSVLTISSNGEGGGSLMFSISMGNLRIFHGHNLGFPEDEMTTILSEITTHAVAADVAIVAAGGSSEEELRTPLRIIRALRPQIVVTMHGSLDEQNVLKTLIEGESKSIEVLIPERLWVYELVTT